MMALPEPIIPQEYMMPGNPFDFLPLPDGQDARQLRLNPLRKALEAIPGLGIKPTFGGAELLRIYEAALLAKFAEMPCAASPGSRSRNLDRNLLQEAAKALAGGA